MRERAPGGHRDPQAGTPGIKQSRTDAQGCFANDGQSSLQSSCRLPAPTPASPTHLATSAAQEFTALLEGKGSLRSGWKEAEVGGNEAAPE